MSIETDRKGRTLVLRMNRPDALNALDVESMIDLNAALREFRDNPDLLVAVITGAGERAFCTGADLKRTMPSDAGLRRDLLLALRPERGVRPLRAGDHDQ